MSSPCDLSAVEARRRIGAGSLCPVDLLESCVQRIEAVDALLNAIVAMDLDGARATAIAAREAVRAGAPLGPLHGLPVGIKDLIDTAGLRTTYGSLLYADHVPAEDEDVAARLRAAGGVVLAKTNCPEWGAGGNTTNPVYGASGNPFAPELTCGGSSGGSAVALATGMLPLAHGSDNAGSLRIPASFCGVVGFRPSPGLVPSRRRAMGQSHLMTEGPMGRDVADTHLALQGLLAEDFTDWLSTPVDPALRSALTPLDPSALRVTVSADLGFAPLESSLRDIFEARMEALAPAFAQVTRRDPDFTDVDQTYDVLRSVAYLATWDERFEELGESVGRLVADNMRSARRLDVRDVGRAFANHTRIYRRFQACFEDCDLLLCPTMGVRPWAKQVLFPTEVDGRPMRHYFHYVAMTYAITLTGHPAISIPCGLDAGGLPFGLQIVGPRHGDLLVLRAALALERHLADLGLGRPLPDLRALGTAGRDA